jgi:hypothetical protein
VNAGDLAAYGPLLAEVRARITSARSRAALSVNAEMLHLYWDIGRMIDARQQEEGWGRGVIPRLAADIRDDLPDIRGFSARNLDRMVAFYRAYSRHHEISPQAVAQMADPSADDPARGCSPCPGGTTLSSSPRSRTRAPGSGTWGGLSTRGGAGPS